jgi:mannitol-specific phosphotransferase system IIBC component
MNTTNQLIEAIESNEINKHSSMEIVAKAIGILGPDTFDKEQLLNTIKELMDKEDFLPEQTIYEMNNLLDSTKYDQIIQNIMDIGNGRWDRILKTN